MSKFSETYEDYMRMPAHIIRYQYKKLEEWRKKQSNSFDTLLG